MYPKLLRAPLSRDDKVEGMRRWHGGVEKAEGLRFPPVSQDSLHLVVQCWGVKEAISNGV